MKKLFLLIGIISMTFIGYSQEDGKGTIDAQRPTLTESYSIIKTDMIQFENGLDYLGNSDTFGYGTFIRGSVSDRVELRVFTDYRNFNSVGGKFIVMEPDKFGVGASFVANYNFVRNSTDFRVAMTKDFGKVFTTYNLGYNGDIYNILLIGVPIGDKWSWIGEYYNDPNMNRLHTAIAWIPQRDIQLDVNGGWMDTDEWYTGLGVSFRLR
jgi:hypothetical protein